MLCHPYSVASVNANELEKALCSEHFYTPLSIVRIESIVIVVHRSYLKKDLSANFSRHT